jgi:fermentation-respiration switch protein FrsA (DUF1100 family)
MKHKPAKGRKLVIDLLIGAVLFYLGVLLVLFMIQSSFIYFPDITRPDPAMFGVPDMKTVTVRTDDGLLLEGWYTAPKDPDGPVIVLFHGNGGHMGIRAFKSRGYVERGYGFLLAEYRGYGGNPGSPGEKGFYDDAKAYIEWLIKDQGIAESKIILYGESLGTGVATEMALQYPAIAALVLETPYTSLTELAQSQFFFVPAFLLIRDRFDSMRKIGSVKAPVLILHGKHDIVVPFHYGEKLFAAAKEPKEMAVYPDGGHNDLYMHGAGNDVLRFLDEKLR